MERCQRRLEQLKSALENRLEAVSARSSRVEHELQSRLAEYLHDEILQNLIFIRNELHVLLRDARLEGRQTKLDRIERILEDTTRHARAMTFELNPPVLLELGFIPAVESVSEQMRRQHALDVRIEADDPLENLPEEIAFSLFRAVRELLTNVVKHARAHSARICIRQLEHRMEVAVEDDGVGFDPAVLREGGGFGLPHLRKKLRYLGGRLTIRSRPHSGTRVVLTIPVR